MPRVISLGLSKPSKLVKDIIYVSLESCGEDGIRATAVSNEDFEYDTHSIEGDPLHFSDKSASNLRGNKHGTWLNPYQRFLDNLVKNNEGILSYDKLVKESTSLHYKCKDIAEIVSEFK